MEEDYVSDISGGMWGDSGSYSFNAPDYGFATDFLTSGSVDQSASFGDFNLSNMTFGNDGTSPVFDSASANDPYALSGFDSSGSSSSSGNWLDSFLNNKNALGMTAVGLNALSGYLTASQVGAQAGSAAAMQSAQLAQRQKEIDDQVKRSAWVNVSKENWRPITEGGSQTGILAAAMKK